jgi:hypothetical protein
MTLKQSRGLDGPFIFTSASCAIYARIHAAGNMLQCMSPKVALHDVRGPPDRIKGTSNNGDFLVGSNAGAARR